MELSQKPCKSFSKYKAERAPKCRCLPCRQKWDAAQRLRKLGATITTALKAITELYPHDSTAPGLVFSFLPEGARRFYASFVRYDGGAKQVIASAKASSLEDALDELTRRWYAGVSSARKMARSVRARSDFDRLGECEF